MKFLIWFWLLIMLYHSEVTGSYFSTKYFHLIRCKLCILTKNIMMNNSIFTNNEDLKRYQLIHIRLLHKLSSNLNKQLHSKLYIYYYYEKLWEIEMRLSSIYGVSFILVLAYFFSISGRYKKYFLSIVQNLKLFIIDKIHSFHAFLRS